MIGYDSAMLKTLKLMRSMGPGGEPGAGQAWNREKKTNYWYRRRGV